MDQIGFIAARFFNRENEWKRERESIRDDKDRFVSWEKDIILYR